MPEGSPVGTPNTYRFTALTATATMVPGGGLPSLSPAYLPLAYWRAPSPTPSLREGGFCYSRGFAPCIPGWAGRGTGSTSVSGAPVGRALGVASLAQNCQNRLSIGSAGSQERGDRGEELRRLRWSSPRGRDNKCRAGQSPQCVFHSGRDSKCRAGLAPRGIGSPSRRR